MKQSTIDPRRGYSVDAGAFYLGISVRKMNYLLAEGAIRTVRIGRRVLLDKADLDAYFESRKGTAV